MGSRNEMKNQKPNCSQLGLNRMRVGIPDGHVTPTNTVFLGYNDYWEFNLTPSYA